jgi:hypothetical protein
MNSARERKPLTGRSNFSTARDSVPASSARSGISLDSARKRELNDPLYVHKPYTPEIKYVSVVERRPALPKSRYPLIPPDDTPPRRRRPSICPEDFIKKNTELNWFEAADFRSLLDLENKRQFARGFIERNAARMWIYDRKYLNKDHNDICEEMIQSPHFMMDMVCFHRQEKALAIGMNSDKVYAAMDERKLHVPKSKEPCSDPFGRSLTTSRDDREAKMRTLLMPASQQSLQSIYRRGYKHSSDFGNFSTWNGVLKSQGLLKDS